MGTFSLILSVNISFFHVFSGKIYVFGGRRSKDRNDINSYDVLTQEWKDVSPMRNIKNPLTEW